MKSERSRGLGIAQLALLWVPASVLGVHAALLTHIRFALGVWPKQYQIPEILEEGGTLLTAHRDLANLGFYALPLALVGFAAVSALRHRRGIPLPSWREWAVLSAPFAIWVAVVLAFDEVARFYGWLWD